MERQLNRSKLKINETHPKHQLKLTITNTTSHHHSQHFPFKVPKYTSISNNTKHKYFSKHSNKSQINLSLTSKILNSKNNSNLNTITLSSPSKHKSLPNLRLITKRKETLTNIKQLTSSPPKDAFLIQSDVRLSSLSKTLRKSPIFSSTLKLNEYLIHYYPIKNPNPGHISEYSKLLAHVSDNSYDKMNRLQSKRLSTIASKGDLNLLEKEKLACDKYDEREVKNKYYEYIIKKKMNLNMNVFNKIKSTLGKKEYTSHSVLDDLNYNNLKRVIKLKKILNTSNEQKVNERLHKKLDKKKNDIIANIKYDDTPSFAKKKFRKETLNKFKCASCSFFGVPV